MTSLRSSQSLVALLLLLLVLLPTGAYAQEAALPDEMEDPIAAMEPEVHEPDVVAPAPDAEAQGAIPEAEGIVEAEAVAGTGRAATTPDAPTVSGSGQLPFTGPVPGRMMQLFLAGSVLLAGGIVSLAWAGARSRIA